MITGSNIFEKKRANLRHFLSLLALGGSITAAPAGALELGELTVDSYLGEPLHASIAYALAPNEMLSDTCVFVSAGLSTSGLLGVGASTVSITERAIVITGNTAIREPMLGARVTINCPFTPNLSREYMVLVDPYTLEAGSWLTVPSLNGTAPGVSAAASASRIPDAAEISPPVSDAPTAPDTGRSVETVATYEPGEFDEPAEVPEEVPVESAASTDSTADLKPGDVIFDGILPTPAETIDTPETELEGSRTTSPSPNVPAAIISTGARSESTSTLMWLVGGGVAIIAALLLFGRRARARLGSTPVAPASVVRDSRQADATAHATAVADYDIDDDSPTEENLALDVDLGIGRGLQEGVEVHVARDFGFAATTDLDFELPLEAEGRATDGDTDIIPPFARNIESILESEVLLEDDGYDLSVTMDATKMPQPEDVTERNLQTVAVDSPDDDEDEDRFTINQETR